MSSLKLIIAMIILLVIFYLAGLSFMTREDRPKTGSERRITPCPQTPNCVNSETAEAQHTIAPFILVENNAQLSWQKLISAVQLAGGEIIVQDDHYLHAVFTSTLFRFKDDLEAALKDDRIAIRSASRAGKSDLGQNRKRIEKIRMLYNPG
jgi:uncharacterized protein (DUF1499 family)